MNDATVPLRAATPRRSPAFAIAVTWALAAIVTLCVAAETRIGPVILKLTPKHGVHMGDLAVFFGCTAIALVVTAALLSRPRR
ncbi:MAG: hypothetical protein J0I34_06460 [Pseudonocardia sp.]|uniref:hypothetical protein n=1 Tax=unclassified Pseudonocardia TaxID=2619320 RepID=UPI0008692886|nr:MULTISPECIES: hypothetical protein [unclassified Pseudonocardia]MBN9108406.1 hypothetical protein [Pseudonocardia sp.]ODU19485.1 MAG: hypothetical protein ABS80_19445 [Pseudonocardia sp. SCN 72-51]ODV08778.1 MAG: hypothetical protein ABT15_02935 [Pseudonocardia sp. SCN 73-27]